MEAHRYDAAEAAITRAFEAGFDTTRLLNAVHADQRATAAWIQLQQHVKRLEAG